MTQFTKTLLLAGVAILSLNACTDSKGPGTLGSKNDIVVKNNGMPGAQKAGDTQISSATEQVAPLPPAEVAAGEPVPAPEGQEPLPSSDPAVEAAAQKVQESKAPVQASTSTPVSDGTTASSAPTTDTVPADVVAVESVKDQEVVPPQLEGTSTETEPVTGPTTQAAATPVYPKVAEPTPAAVPAAEESSPAAVPTTPTPAVTTPISSASTVVAKPSGTHDTAYSIPAPAGSASATTSAEAAVPVAATAPASGTINPYDPAIIKAAQSALATKAGYTGAANGELSSEFLNALSKYQSENKLTPGGVNTETLRHLGVIE